MSLLFHVLAFSCLYCQHYDSDRTTPCWFYDKCKAGKPLAGTPRCFLGRSLKDGDAK